MNLIKLGDKGYFDESHKKPIPRFPKKIGVITASTGAAIRDIITTINRRYNLAEIILFPCLVQGENAKDDIAFNIKLADSYNLDTIIVGRGGGSIEDLWAFNEEIVAEAIFNAKTPIISAVGHEIDFTISDFVSDLRAPTPTAAAELAVPNKDDIKKLIEQLKSRVVKSTINNLKYNKKRLEVLLNSYVLKTPETIYEVKMQKVDLLIEKLIMYTNNILDNKSYRFTSLIDKLEALSPIKTLKRGYSITRVDNKIISNINKLKEGMIIKTELNEGIITSKIMEVKNGN